jgi:RNA polymerase sigma factor (sigma-70 family)
MTPADRFANSRVFCELWRVLTDIISRRYPWAGFEMIEDAVMDAIVLHLKQHGECPAGGEEGWKLSLFRTAGRNVCNRIRDNKRRCRREQEYTGQEKRENFVLRNDSVEHIEEEETRQVQRQQLKQMLRHLPASERSFVELRSRGVEDVRSYVELLGVTEDTVEQQQRAIKKEWDRLRMKLRRLA